MSTTERIEEAELVGLTAELSAWRSSVGTEERPGAPGPEADAAGLRLETVLRDTSGGPRADRLTGPAHFELGWWRHARSWLADGARDRDEFRTALEHIALVRLLSHDTMPFSALPAEIARCARGELPDGTWQMDAWLDVDAQRLLVALGGDGSLDRHRELVGVARRRLASGTGGGDVARVTALASALRMLGTRGADPAPLGEATDLLRELLRLDLDPIHEGGVRCNLANTLWERFELTDERELIDEAWESALAACELLEPVPDQHLTAVAALARVGLVLFHATQDQEVLATALAEAEAAFDAGHPGRQREMSALAATLAQLLTWQYVLTGRATDLDRRVDLGRRAVETAASAPQLVIAHAALAEALVDRFRQLDDPGDLDAAVGNQERAVALLSDDDPLQHEMRANLAGYLRDLGALRGARPHLDRAVAESARALALCPPNDPNRPRTLEIAATTLRARYRLFQDPADLDDAAAAAHEAARTTTATDPELARRYGHLGVILETRFFLAPDRVGIDELIRVGQAAVDACHATATEYAGHLFSLACFYEHRFALAGDPPDALRAQELFADAGDHPLGPASVRYDAAVQAARLAERLGDTDRAYAGYRTASRLLAELAWRGVPLARRVRALEDHGWVVAAAAELALEAGRVDDALEVLEESRQQIWQQDSELSADLTAVRRADPARADALDAARARLVDVEHAPARSESSVASRPVGASAIDTAGAARRSALAEWDELLADARMLPGLGGLLRRPDTRSLAHAVAGRPVVYVVPGRRSGYAVVLRGDEVRAIRLPRATREATAEAAGSTREALSRLGAEEPEWVGAQVRQLLEWCWVSVVAPVLRVLDWIDPPGSPDELAARRVWWCPTGPLVSMPLHAAQSSGGGTLAVISALERCVSSFTSSLRGLAEAVGGTAALGPVRHVALVGSSDGLPASPLPHVHSELDAVASQVPAHERRDDPSPTVAEVLDLVARSSAIHIAGHARNQDGSTPAALLLRDGAVELPMLGAHRPTAPAWAFISACGTAESEPGIADEHLTLAAGFQAAGYPYVVGTLWSIVDEPAAEFAREVYGRIRRPDGLDLTRTAAAMNAVSAQLRAQYPEYPFLWAGHVHFGPS